MKYDLELRPNSGTHKGEWYRYILATVNGTKAWDVNPTFNPAPSMYKDKIKLSILAAENNVDASGSIELRGVNKILDELRDIADTKEPITMKGLDKVERLVRITQDGFTQVATLKEKDKSPEYRINFSCLGMYKYGNYKE